MLPNRADGIFAIAGCADNRLIRTPKVDPIAANGLRFRNYFVTIPFVSHIFRPLRHFAFIHV